MSKNSIARKGGAALALLCLATSPLPAHAEPALKDSAPPLAVQTIAGGEFNLAAMRGKVVLVDFWASWCVNCLVEFPTVSKFYQKHHAQGFEVIALSIDKPRDRAKMQRLSAKLPFPAALLSEASQNGFGTPEAVPVSFVIDARGVVRDKFIAIDDELLNGIVAPLLKEAQPETADAAR